MWRDIFYWVVDQLNQNNFLSGGIGVAAFTAVLYQLKSFPMMMYRFIKHKFTVTITIRNTEDVYESALRWLIGKVKHSPELLLMDYWHNGVNVGLLTMSEGWYPYFYKKWPIIIKRNIDRELSNHRENPVFETLSFTFVIKPSAEVLKAFIAELLESKEGSVDIFNYVGYWTSYTSRCARSMESVMMGPELKAHFLNDVDRFINDKEFYQTNGITYKRNYLLTGLPGTGKSSLILALASRLKRNIYTVNLKSMNDKLIVAAYANISAHSIVVIEDIDVSISSVTINDDNDNNVGIGMDKEISLTTLLNILDGLNTKEDIITIITTNHQERINSVLLRKGRIDYHLHLKPLDRTISEQMVKRFYPFAKDKEVISYLNGVSFPITGAELQEHLLSHPID